MNSSLKTESSEKRCILGAKATTIVPSLCIKPESVAASWEAVIALTSEVSSSRSLICFNQSEDPRTAQYSIKAADCYEKYLQISGYSGVAIEIPYEGTTLPGHFYRSPVTEEKAPLIILVPGRDTWAEDTRWLYDGLLKRCIHCLCFDGTGQGTPIRIQKLPFRPDFENVMTPVIDYALKTFPEIDGERICQDISTGHR